MMEILGLLIALTIICWTVEDMLFPKRVPYGYRHARGSCGGICDGCDPH